MCKGLIMEAPTAGTRQAHSHLLTLALQASAQGGPRLFPICPSWGFLGVVTDVSRTWNLIFGDFRSLGTSRPSLPSLIFCVLSMQN